MIQGVIIEGLSTTGKSSVFSALKRLHSQTNHRENTIIAISEHYSQVLHSYQGVLRSMAKDEHIQLLDRHVDYLEQQSNWMDSLGHTKPSTGVFYLLERFHVNHRAAFANSAEFERLEKRLSRLNAHCVLLTLSRDAVKSRFIESRGELRETIVNSHFRDQHRRSRLGFLCKTNTHVMKGTALVDQSLTGKGRDNFIDYSFRSTSIKYGFSTRY